MPSYGLDGVCIELDRDRLLDAHAVQTVRKYLPMVVGLAGGREAGCKHRRQVLLLCVLPQKMGVVAIVPGRRAQQHERLAAQELNQGGERGVAPQQSLGRRLARHTLVRTFATECFARGRSAGEAASAAMSRNIDRRTSGFAARRTSALARTIAGRQRVEHLEL